MSGVGGRVVDFSCCYVWVKAPFSGVCCTNRLITGLYIKRPVTFTGTVDRAEFLPALAFSRLCFWGLLLFRIRVVRFIAVHMTFDFGLI